MTAIAVACGAGGALADAAVRRMLDAAAHRGAEPATTWIADGATIGYRAARSRRGVPGQPFAVSAAGSAIAFDGHLDNRDDLLRALGVDSSATDAALTLAAYAKWAEEAAAQLIGDFAYAIWDADLRRLVCARDAMGQRPLFYGVVDGITLVASEPQQLLAHPGFEAVANEGVIAEYLTRMPASVEETIWTGVTRLPPAHTLVVSDAGSRRHRHWDFDPDAEVKYSRDEEYAEHFMALLGTAVECRTRDAASVGVFLSGGLDSSAVAGVAELQARQRGVSPVRAFSALFPGLAADETPYIDAVVQKWALPSVRFPARAATREDIELELDRYRDLPKYPNGAAMDALGRVAAAEVDVALTGVGGDEWFAGSVVHTADLLAEGRFVAAFRQFRADAALPGRGFTRADLLRVAVAPLLPRVVRAALRPIAGGRRPAYEWIRPEFARRVDLQERLRPGPPGAGRTYAQRAMHRMNGSALQMLGDEMEDRTAAAAGLDQRHPLHDRRLAEFGFALPESQRWSSGETKVLLRRAAAPVLPGSVLARNDKAEFSSTFVDALECLGGRAFFSRLLSEEAGWVDGAVARRMYDQMNALYSRGSESYSPLAGVLWSIAGIELWLNHRRKERCQ
jgi:asparagine synthase (glutamine-hydrolysing)